MPLSRMLWKRELHYSNVLLSSDPVLHVAGILWGWHLVLAHCCYSVSSIILACLSRPWQTIHSIPSHIATRTTITCTIWLYVCQWWSINGPQYQYDERYHQIITSYMYVMFNMFNVIEYCLIYSLCNNEKNLLIKIVGLDCLFSLKTNKIRNNKKGEIHMFKTCHRTCLSIDRNYYNF